MEIISLPEAAWHQWPVLLNGEVNDASSNLEWDIVELVSNGNGLLDVNKGSEFGIIVINVEVILFQFDQCMASGDWYISDSDITIMATALIRKLCKFQFSKKENSNFRTIFIP